MSQLSQERSVTIDRGEPSLSNNLRVLNVEKDRVTVSLQGVNDQGSKLCRSEVQNQDGLVLRASELSENPQFSVGINSTLSGKLNVFDWLANMELPNGQAAFDIVEIRFKNSRKDFFKNVNNLQLNVGDAIAVEATSGHDIGVVSMSGELVRLQMKKKGILTTSEEIKKVYRKAKNNDLEKWQEAQNLEQATMYRARTIAIKLNLQMKISDVEYQGDKTKAVFFYTADDRVDFRELIKVMADEFKVRIEMRQIGARQEAGRLGGIGSCGRELCCATWLTDFRSVSTSAARYQQLSLNPMKLAGQCGKLKCCLNYELDNYLDVIKDFPEVANVKLESEKGKAFHQKTDIFKRIMFFSYISEPDNFIPLSIERVKEIIEMNKTGLKPADLSLKVAIKLIDKIPDYENVVGQDSLTRFDKIKKQKQKNNNNNNKKRNVGVNPNNQNVKTKTNNNTQLPAGKNHNKNNNKEHKTILNKPNPSPARHNNNNNNKAPQQGH